MKSKLFLISFFTIISSVGLTLPTFAVAPESDNKKFWTIPELIELREEDVMERGSLCEEDLECEINRHFELLERGGEYSILNSFNNMILLITSINPSNSTIRVLFHDENPMMRRMGEMEPAILDEIFIAWFSSQPIMFNNYYAKHSHYSMEMSFLFSGSASTNGYGWFTPNQEVELQIDHAEALLKSPHYIFFTMEGENTSVSGMHDYSNCIESPFFEEGMECRMVFDDTGNFDFLPFWPGSDSPAYNPYSIEEGYGGTIDDNTESNSDIITDNPETAATPSEENDAQATQLADATPETALNYPDTGSFTESPNPSKRDKNSVWCPILIIFLSDLFIFWWFWPEERSH